MYKFVDTTEASDGAFLPSEALRINGEYLENIIPGYRTLSVEGREALSPEIETIETGTRDGSALKNKRYPARVLVVHYQIIVDGAEAFRTSYNQLAQALDVEDAELIFNDEPDKFFIGTPSGIGDVEPGRNAVVGEFEILCVDPFKYSTTVYEAEPTIETVTDEDGNDIVEQFFNVVYGGTYKSRPTFEIVFYEENEADGDSTTALTGNGDCGFVAFFNEEGKIIQLGDPDEAQGETYTKSQTLVNQSFKKSTAWGTAAQSLWAKNNAFTFGAIELVGSLKHEDAKDVSNNDYFLNVSSYGAGAGIHGVAITHAIPADANGEVGASDFTFTYSQKMCIGNNSSSGQKQRGVFQVLLNERTDTTLKVVAGLSIAKHSVGKSADLNFCVNNSDKYGNVQIDMSLNNTNFGQDTDKIKPIKTTTIKKEGDTLTVNVGGKKWSFTEPGMADSKVNEITFVFAQYGTYPDLGYNGLYSAKFVKNNCEMWRNVPNKFSANDVLVANCDSGEVFMNGTTAPEYGALGNDWEDFCLKPGINQIGIAYSDWVEADYAPTFKMRFREVFL